MRLFWILGSLIWLMGSLGTLFSGPCPTWPALKEIISHNYTEWNPILDERLPRWLILSLSGSSLAIAGAAMQALFHNPLASPSSLGVTSGGSLAVVLAHCLGVAPFLPISIPLLAFMGSLLTLITVYSAARFQSTGHTLLLVGMALSTLFGAIENSLLYWIRDDWNLTRILFEWSHSSCLDCGWSNLNLLLPCCLVGIYGIWSLRREIDLLSLGEEQAVALGVEVKSVRHQLFFYVCLISGSNLASLGSLPFFGLLLPHLVRQICGARHELLLPGALLSGAGLLCLLDWLLRIAQLDFLSLGNICAVAGAVGFFLLFLKQQRIAL